MCGPGVEILELMEEEEANEKLDKHLKDLKELVKSAILYRKTEQWVLLERTNKSISDLTNIVRNNLDEFERWVPENVE